MRLLVYTDGACWGNPGPAAIGAVVKDEKQQTLIEVSQYIGKGTYKAVIAGLKSAARLKADQLVLYLDSELIIRQLSGDYKVKNVLLRPLYVETVGLLKQFKSVSIKFVGHSGNDDAHNLAKAALKSNVKNNKDNWV